LLLAELLQINPIHPAMDSEIAAHGKGVGNYLTLAPQAAHFELNIPHIASPPIHQEQDSP
jgi:hypothetical protein